MIKSFYRQAKTILLVYKITKYKKNLNVFFPCKNAAANVSAISDAYNKILYNLINKIVESHLYS